MLARMASNFYWLGRYVERTENTARLLGSRALPSIRDGSDRRTAARHRPHRCAPPARRAAPFGAPHGGLPRDGPGNGRAGGGGCFDLRDADRREQGTVRGPHGDLRRLPGDTGLPS
ncbi:alpha-E domain-containing protein [Candidatus Palauibacter sp.]|uniref:alpha-E domain-containing protein n=1 Tax=Candidatus Palauibacter sp. TaxID=3101350 RepID=UPI003B527AB8